MSAAAAFEEDADTAVGVWAIVVAAGAGSRFGGAEAVRAPRRPPCRRLVARDGTRRVRTEVVLVVPPDRAELPEAADHVVAGGRDPL